MLTPECQAKIKNELTPGCLAIKMHNYEKNTRVPGVKTHNYKRNT